MWTLLVAALAGPGLDNTPEHGFRTLEPGLELGVFVSPVKSGIGDERIHVLRADPTLWALDLGLASEPGASGHGAPDWLEREGWVAVINAAMFLTDHKSSVFMLQHGEHVNQPRWHDNASNVLSFNATGARIIDVKCDDWAGERKRFTSFVQSYRLLDCNRRPVWGHKGGRRWSHALIGMDGEGRLLFIHARSPWTTRAFTEILLGLPLDVQRLQYAEGGPEASLVVKTESFELQRMGSYETGFVENDDNHRFWTLPIVVGLERRSLGEPAERGR